jgi:predicted O-linked N-acetylglucosamine transferase (SPINDLY family)
LREHAVGYLMTEVFGLHNRANVEVFAYYCGPTASDPLHANFKAAADHWSSISDLDDVSAAQRIAQDEIQILVDLNGYTREARLKLVAQRPAPVIVNWLGFPGTMASPYHHYIIADDWIIPKTHEIYYSERVLRLPCYQPNNRKRNVSPRAPSRAEAGLPEKGIVYCCFNGAHKISQFTFDRWLMVLARVPGSVLWLLGNTAATNERLRDYAARRGIARERLVFAEKLANPAHLARYVLADLFLDTTPYGAHTTASDALWMGIPVLTLSGRSFASRVCGSLARAAGIPELVCTSAEEFVERAVDLGNGPTLRSLRERLRAGRDSCTLFDMPLLVRHLEKLYGQMWEQFERGELPRPDLANLDVYLEVGSQVNHEELEIQTVVDYHGWWREMLAGRHGFRPMEPDRRLLTNPP